MSVASCESPTRRLVGVFGRTESSDLACRAVAAINETCDAVNPACLARSAQVGAAPPRPAALQADVRMQLVHAEPIDRFACAPAALGNVELFFNEERPPAHVWSPESQHCRFVHVWP